MGNLQEANTEHRNEDDLFVQRQLQFVEVRHGQRQHRDVSDQVDNARDSEAEDLVTTLATRDLSPVHGDRLADKKAGKDGPNCPGCYQAHGTPCGVLDGGYGEDLGVQEQDRDLGEGQRQCPKDLKWDQQLNLKSV